MVLFLIYCTVICFCLNISYNNCWRFKTSMIAMSELCLLALILYMIWQIFSSVEKREERRDREKVEEVQVTATRGSAQRRTLRHSLTDYFQLSLLLWLRRRGLQG